MLLQPESLSGVVFDTRSFNTRTQELTKLLQHRMSKPQRHRLLHGFPLAAAMPFASDAIGRVSDTIADVLAHHQIGTRTQRAGSSESLDKRQQRRS